MVKIMACVKIRTRTHESFCELNSELERTNTITTLLYHPHTGEFSDSLNSPNTRLHTMLRCNLNNNQYKYTPTRYPRIPVPFWVKVLRGKLYFLFTLLSTTINQSYL